MAADELTQLSAVELTSLVRSRDVSPVDVVESYLTRSEAHGQRTNSFTVILAEEARERARRMSAVLAKGNASGRLLGLPVAIKDLFDFKAHVPNTFGVKALAGYVPSETAPHVGRLEAEGGIIIGKTNTCEFGHKGTTDNRLFGPTSTPWRAHHNAGGSSGGSAAAVADRLCSVAQGSDGGGSVRIPAALCGIVGMKPTPGRVPGVTRPDAFFAVAPFMGNGPLGRSVTDCALLLDSMVAFDALDPFSVPPDGTSFLRSTTQGVTGAHVAYLPTMGGFPVESEVARVVDAAVRLMPDLGVHVATPAFTMPCPHEDVTALWIRLAGASMVGVCEAFAVEGVDLRAPGCWDELPAQLREATEHARSTSVERMRRDQILRTMVLDAIGSLFAEHDLVVSPTIGVAAVPNGTDGWTVGPNTVAGQSVDPLLGWCLTHPYNLSGHPAISIPAGLTSDGFPVGLQIAGRRFEDHRVIAFAAALERALPPLPQPPCPRTRPGRITR